MGAALLDIADPDRALRRRSPLPPEVRDLRGWAQLPGHRPNADICRMEWGSVAEIVAAACTIVTVAVSVFIGVQQIGERREAQALLISERERARRSNAEAVTAWVETRTSRRGKQTATLHVQNASRHPVFAASIVPRTYYKRRARAPIICDVLPPGVDMPEDFTDSARGLVEGEGGNHDIAQRIGVRIRFRDSAGQSWERSIDGRLHEHENNPADFDFSHPYRDASDSTGSE